jgi:hypothetical protein
MSKDKEQQSILVPQHKRLAQGAPINGQSMKDTGKKTASPLSKKK